MPSARDYADELAGILIDRSLGSQRHPSHQMLERAEGAIVDRAMAEEYLDRLLDLVASQRYPSHHILERIARVIRVLATAEALAEQQENAA
ncbi:hypothetical protein [Egicoccus sp. AB-alg2]|uniref:hypothetical protein n=1 Tax=Egicoccus sp. AB-alg2 TaxID=3242693 RepID=UPI00359EF890